MFLRPVNSICLLLGLLLTSGCGTKSEPQGTESKASLDVTKQDSKKYPVEIVSAKLTRTSEGNYEALLTLEQDISPEIKKQDIRFLFLKDDAGISPKMATDVKTEGSMEMSVAYPWARTGGLLSEREREIGFVLDLSDMRGWTGSKLKEILVPLNSQNLLASMGLRLDEGKGQMFVAFVKYGPDGNTKIIMSNTVRMAVEPAR
jgi:hypothetical protein